MSSLADIEIKKFQNSIINFEDSEEAQDFYYQVMDTTTGKKNKSGSDETVRDKILKIYGMLFCDDISDFQR